jgi:hypothetical protein
MMQDCGSKKFEDWLAESPLEDAEQSEWDAWFAARPAPAKVTVLGGNHVVTRDQISRGAASIFQEIEKAFAQTYRGA